MHLEQYMLDTACLVKELIEELLSINCSNTENRGFIFQFVLILTARLDAAVKRAKWLFVCYAP